MFTEQQILEIQRKLASKGIKDTDLRTLTLEEIDGEEWVAVVSNGQNRKVKLKDIYDGFQSIEVPDIEEIREGAHRGMTAYQKPSDGIPSTDMTSEVQNSLGKADTAYQKPNTGIPSTDMTSEVQTSLGKADSAYQKPVDGIPYTDMSAGVKASLDKADQAALDIAAIEALIPPQATSTNKLADKDFVNSSIATATATFRGTYNLVSDLGLTTSATQAQIGTALDTAITGEDNNDYSFVQIPTADATPTEIARIDRYKYNGTTWAYEYSLNNSGFTAAQWAAINSNITAQKVEEISQKYVKPSGGIPKSDLASDVQTSLGKADTALQEHQSLADYYTKEEIDARYEGEEIVEDYDTILYRPTANGKLAETVREYTFTYVNAPTGNPNTQGWYEKIANEEYVLTADTTATANKAYYVRKGAEDKGSVVIQKILGNTIKWNQLNNFSLNSGVVNRATYSDGILLANNTNGQVYWRGSIPPKGHKVFACAIIKTTAAANKVRMFFDGESISKNNVASNDIQRIQTITTVNNGISDVFGIRDLRTSDWDNIYIYGFICLDLTAIFGSGNELTTVPEIDSWLFANIPIVANYGYGYTPGMLIGNKAVGIKTVGFNQWDEEWEAGGIDIDTGQNGESGVPNAWRAKNYINVFPNTEYAFTNVGDSNSFRFFFYDANKNYLGFMSSLVALSNGVFTTPEKCYYVRFRYPNAHTDDDNKICINLLWSGYRKGEYEPYWEQTRQLNLSTLTGKLNGAGNSITVFPYGLNKVGSVQDEIVGNKAIKRIGVVDMGTLTWTLSSADNTFYSNNLTDKSIGDTNIVSPKYIVISVSWTSMPDKSIKGNGTGTNIWAHDSSYSTAADFKAAMSGVPLYYELATPEEYILDEEINTTYKVADFGIEQVLPATLDANSLPQTAPFSGELEYRQQYISADDINGMENYATAEQGSKADSAYQLPSGGIPKTDMASAVQTSLGKADSALQPNALNGYYNKTQIDSRYGGDTTLTDDATFIYRSVADGKLTSMARNYVFTVVNNPSGNPSTSGWYEKTNNDKYTPTADTTVTANKIYYARSVDGACPAQIKSVRGKSLVWNQLVQNGNFASTDNWVPSSNNNFSVSVNENIGTTTVLRDNTTISGGLKQNLSKPTVSGHKYLYTITYKTSYTNKTVRLYLKDTDQFLFTASAPGDVWTKKSGVFDATGGSTLLLLYMIYTGSSTTGDACYVKDVMLIDLTLMFGQGNEPTTVEEFEAMFPLPYYAYNAGALISNKTEQVESVGFNQWDEETYACGKIIKPDGTGISDNSSYITLGSFDNPIMVLPNSNYIVSVGGTISSKYVIFFDVNKNTISGRTYISNTTHITTPSNASFMVVSIPYTGTTYNHDICINFSDPSRNGEYEPYKKNTVTLNLQTLTGKLNGEGESVVVFPDGLKSAGSVYDEIVGNKAIKRVGVVDLGTLTWNYSSSRFYSNVLSQEAAVNNYKFKNEINSYGYFDSTKPISNEPTDKAMALYQGAIYLYNTAYSDAATFKTAMSGVMLYYELATPEEYILDEPIPDTFQVDINGTERRLPEDTSTSVTAPFCADILYEPDRSAYYELERKIDTKQDIISDLPEIRSGAQAGAALSGGIVNKITDEFMERPAANGQLFGLNSDYLFERVNNPTGDPSQQGWYESINNGKFVLTEDETAVEGKIYYNKSILKSNGAAQLNEVAGKSQVWNQLVDINYWSVNSATSAGITFTKNAADGSISMSGTATANAFFIATTCPAVIAGHKYYLRGGDFANGYCSNSYDQTAWGSAGQVAPKIITALASETLGETGLRVYVKLGTTLNGEKVYPGFIDLTLLGIDNLATVEEVEAWLAKNIGLKPYYPYNAGTVLNAKMKGIESLGFNLLDPTTGKARIVGAYSDVYGNYYGITGTHGTLTFTSDLGEVSEITPDSDGKFLIETPGWLDVASAGADCAVFLWWDGSKTDYVDYQKNVARLDITHIYGKKNGTGSLVQVWPTGMSGIRNIKDSLEIVDGAIAAKVNIWKYVLTGSETWTKWGDANAYYNTNGLSKRARSYPCIASKLPYASVSDIYSERKAGVATNGSNIYVDGGNYANISNFTGMEIYYALETPELYTDLVYQGSDYFADGTPVTLPVNYIVNEMGIERILPQNTSEAVVTVFPTISSTYVLDTAYKVSRIDETHVSKGSIEDLLTKLEEADIIDSGWSVTYDTTTGKLIYNGIAKPE